MGATIRARMAALEHEAFVGRTEERAAFRLLLTDPVPAHQGVYVHGPGGVGKTTLLREFRWMCDRAGVPVWLADGRHVEPTPAGLLAALGVEAGIDGADVVAHLSDRTRRLVVVVDTCERLASLDGWMRRTLLPELSQQCVLVLAGRDAPGPGWRTRPALQALVRPMPLRNLAPADGRALLGRLGVPDEQVDPVLSFTHGHPLALALVGDVCAQQPDTAFSPRAVLDIIPTLLERLTNDDATGPRRRAALEAATVVWSLTEPLLAAMLDEAVAHDEFAWLRGLGCTESDRDGLHPHDLVRDALVADLRWRNPQRHAVYHERARQHLYERFDAASGSGQRAVLFDLLYLHRDNPMVAPFFDWESSGGLVADPLEERDVPLLLDAVRRYEGEAAAEVAGHWFARRPERTLVLRGRGAVGGFLTMVGLHDAEAGDLAVDPVAAAVHAHLAATAPLRGGEVATLFRSWMALDTHQAVSPIQGAVFLEVARHYLTTPRLARTYFCCVDGAFWEPTLAYWDVPRVPDTQFSPSPDVAVFAHDWRERPPVAWLDLLAERETGREPTPPEAVPPSVVVLSREDFAAAVHDALRDLHRPDRLADNPLVQSRLVFDQVGADTPLSTRVAGLVALVTATTDAAVDDPRTARGHRALQLTFLQPVGTQERAAEFLDLPFSTYRRHLREGLDLVTEQLWRRELGEPPPAEHDDLLRE